MESIICKGTLENDQILRASYIPTGAELVQGDSVYTSGVGGIYPKGIIIGKNGEMLKRIGKMARIDMEENFGTKVNLKTWVKVKEDWKEKDAIVNKFKI